MYHSHINRLTASWGRKWSSLLILFAIVIAGLVQPAAAATTESRVLPQLQNEAAKNPTKTFRVIVTRVNRNKNADNDLANKGGKKVKDLKSGDSFVAELTGSKIAELGKSPAVKLVNYDAPMRKMATIDSSKLATVFTKAVNATNVWSSSASGPSITGAGIGVAVLDTGVNAPNEFKTSTGASRIAAKALFNSSERKTDDGNGHGTHVAGIIAGNNWYNGGLLTTVKGKYIGIAPEAKIINVRVSDENGMSYVSDVVDAIDWVIANRQTYNIRVMNLSLLSSVAESARTSVLSAAVERAWFNGVLVVVASGNSGANTMQYPPANDPFVVTVGAVDPMNTVAQSDDTIAPWSSYGTTQDGFTKPEVVAPGRYMVAPSAGSWVTLATQDPTRLLDGSYMRLSGTSMAAPVVAGVAALAFQAHPEWTNDQIKWLLLNTSTALNVSAGQGGGEVNAEALVRYNGTPSYANQGLTINEQLVTTNGAVAYNSASWSTASWSTASWSTASWSTASWSTASWSTSNFSTASFTSVDETSVK